MTGAVTLVDGLADRAAACPDDLAVVVDGGRDLTFGEWERRSNALARGLSGRGIGPGDRVALRFDAARWADFAVAYLGTLKTGAVAALVPSGLAASDAARVIRHAGAPGLLCDPPLALGPSPVWTVAPRQVEGDQHAGPWLLRSDPAALAELIYPLAPLARPRPLARTHHDLAVVATALDRPGRLIHTWAPGSLAGQHALALVLVGAAAGAAGHSMATLARFSPAAWWALVERLGAATCGLTPGLAPALVTSGAARPAGLRSVTTVVLSGHRHDPSLGRRLAAPFAQATVLDLGEDCGASPPSERGPVTDEAVEPPPSRKPGPAEDEGAASALAEGAGSAESEDLASGPAGTSQLGMLWHEQLAPSSFNLPSLVRRYRGTLDVGALDRALAQLLRRHEPLRTTFDLTGATPHQVVHDPPPSRLAMIDLGDLEPAARHLEAARLVAEASSRPFDLVCDQLFAPTLVRLGAEDHVLIVRLHHTAFDDWSVDVLRRDLSALYRAFLAGGPSPLPELATRFVEVCRRQHARLAGDVGDEQLAAWRARLAGAPLAVQLRLGDPHQLGPDRPGAGEPLRHDLPPELARQVRAMSPALRATPFMTVLAAFEVLLAARTGQDDLVIASVVAGRGATALEPMIGCFTKKVLLRLRLGGDPTFPELVARTRSTVLEALAHQDLPFEAVVQQTLGRAAARHGLAAQVPVIFQGETPQQARLVLPGLEVGPFEVPASARREQHFSAPRDDQRPERPDGGGSGGSEQTAAWGDGADLGTFLLVSLLESGDGLALMARGVFHRPAAERLLSDLEALLADIVGSPARRISELTTPLRRPEPGDGGDDDDDDDEIALLGLHLRRSRLEAALARCPGVGQVAVGVAEHHDGPRLVACVVADHQPPPTLPQLRATLWSAHPGSPWPAAAVILPPGSALPRLADGGLDLAVLPEPPPTPEPADPDADVLTALWADARGGPASPGSSYWQDFSFLRALAEARAAGLPITDDQVARCRTPEMLATALSAGSAIESAAHG